MQYVRIKLLVLQFKSADEQENRQELLAIQGMFDSLQL